MRAARFACVALVLLGAACSRKSKGVEGISDVSTTAPADAADAPRVAGTVRRWMWEFEDRGVRTPNELVVPSGRFVHLELRTLDDAHRLVVPSLGIDAEVKPGAATDLWVRVRAPGEHVGKCSDDCDAYPSFFATVKALSPEAFASRTRADEEPPPGQSRPRWGQDLAKRLGCPTCHAIDRDGPLGPKLRGMWTAARGDGFVREKILKGAGSMPAFRGTVSDPQLDALVGYLQCGASQPCSASCAGVDLCSVP